MSAERRLELAGTDHGVQLVFGAEPGIANELEALAELERKCCGFAEWAKASTSDWEAGLGSRQLPRSQPVLLERVLYPLITAPWAVGQMLQANDQ